MATRTTTTASRNGHGSAQGAERVPLDPAFELPEVDHDFIDAQRPFWNFLIDRYFRLEVRGWDRLPDAPVLLVGIHAGGILPIDAYAFGFAWFRHFGRDRTARGTAHDFLTSAPGIGDYLGKIGVIPASPEGISAALSQGEDVILYPGGDLDSLRPWWKRDEVVFGGRKGWIRMALDAQVPIVPVANVGASDTLFVITDGERIARTLRLDKLLRAKTFPLGIGFPLGLMPAGVPQIPLPAKLRTEILDPIELDGEPGHQYDDDYVERMERKVVAELQGGVERLAKRRRFPIFG
jgi:1-acyl-sn-glycerol-3-phosphate acyltransferase